METIEVKCPACGGEGDWTEYDENDYTVWVTCPACEGRGVLTVELPEGVTVSRENP